MSEQEQCWQCPRCRRLRWGVRPKTCFGCGHFGYWDRVSERGEVVRDG